MLASKPTPFASPCGLTCSEGHVGEPGEIGAVTGVIGAMCPKLPWSFCRLPQPDAGTFRDPDADARNEALPASKVVSGTAPSGGANLAGWYKYIVRTGNNEIMHDEHRHYCKTIANA